MSDAAISSPTHPRHHSLPAHDPGRPNFSGRTGIAGIIVFVALLAVGLGFVLRGLSVDIRVAGGISCCGRLSSAASG
jgi:hypothetical protein